jgi:peptidoglycan-N-acetylglucosamine deacetylase
LTTRHRVLAFGSVAVLAAGLLAAPARTQVAPPAGAAAAPAAAACGPKAIGLSRTVEIKTAGGPRFGHQQYKENEFLADGEVVLTFDDGPSSVYTPQIVKTLDAHCTKATFFMVGSRALAEPRIVKDIQRRGHTIGTHTWSHANLRAIGAVRAKDEIEMGFSGVQRAAGQPIAPFFRFPYLADSRAMMAHLQSRNIANISIDADAYDYKTLNPAEVHRAIISQITEKRKGIILFHDIQPATAGALNGLLADLKVRGFRVVHMVPSGNATSQPAYDVMATRETSRRLVETANNPLAKRAVTWPMPGVQASPTGAYAPPPSAALAGPGPGPWPQGYAPPPVAGAPLPPQPLQAPPRRRVDDDDWKNKIFSR